MRAAEHGLIAPDDLEGLPRASDAAHMVREASEPGTRRATDALVELRAEENH